ncbi:hypothetical protein SAMN05880501_101193 [Ureibacillus xyleni]|uniref:Lipoprotein n=1 Tax=Ureibacillus xyleni TaxID=614648 RepID=A0A285RE49_9BACL|nr:hypothetical protein [Ureibacillus xyleni]SOB90662.1 hypothetical protein SAMN05880501_101193 [Ureibacillus xyleni]
MKKLVSITLILMLIALVTACSEDKGKEIPDEATKEKIDNIISVTQIIQEYEIITESTIKNVQVSKFNYDYEIINKSEYVVGHLELHKDVSKEDAKVLAEKLYSDFSTVDKTTPTVIKVYQNSKKILQIPEGK